MYQPWKNLEIHHSNHLGLCDSGEELVAKTDSQRGLKSLLVALNSPSALVVLIVYPCDCVRYHWIAGLETAGSYQCFHPRIKLKYQVT